MAEAKDAIGREQEDGDEDRAGDPEGNDEGVVDIAPVRGDRRPPPGADDVKDHRSKRDRNQNKRYQHVSLTLEALQPRGSSSAEPAQ